MDQASSVESTQAWSPEQKWNLAIRLWDEVHASGWQPEPDKELEAELDRRLDAHEANPDDVRTSDQVWERIRRFARSRSDISRL